jgi:hypothetical protein
MILSSAGFAPNLTNQNGFQSKSSGEGGEQNKSTERLNSQVNIQNATEQTLSSAVSPVVKSESLQNHQNKNINKEAIESSQLGQLSKQNSRPLAAPSEASSKSKADETEAAEKSGPEDPQELTEEEQKQVDELKKRDAEVRAHEQAHAAVGGSYASAPTYEFQTGPDNKQYAVGGEVQIDAAPVPNDPKATIEKMDIVIRAALAPQEPSAQDKKVAAEAQKNRSEAQAALAKQQSELNGDDEDESLKAQTTKSEDLKNEAQNKAANNNEQILSAILAYNSASNLGIG